MGDKKPNDDNEEQSYTEKFDNFCFDSNAKKPSEINERCSRKDRLLVLVDCLVPILRRQFTQDEIDFMIAYRANRGDRLLTANALDIAPKTVDNYCTNLITKITKISRLLIKLLKFDE
ncbi:MAG: hypothetical protein V1871_02530 [Planctomycetota bacterium]